MQDWKESQESSNLFAQQRISNVADYVDQLLDPELVHVARKEQREASEGNWVYVRAPVEWYELFQEWLATLPPADRSRYQHRFRDVLFRLDGNLYGRRTAGSVYRDGLEEIMIGKFTKRFHNERGVKNPCVSRCKKTYVVLIHHIDDIKAAGPEEHLNSFLARNFSGTVRSRPESSSG